MRRLSRNWDDVGKGGLHAYPMSCDDRQRCGHVGENKTKIQVVANAALTFYDRVEWRIQMINLPVWVLSEKKRRYIRTSLG